MIPAWWGLFSQLFLLSIYPWFLSRCSKNENSRLGCRKYRLKMFFIRCSLTVWLTLFFSKGLCTLTLASNRQGKDCRPLLFWGLMSRFVFGGDGCRAVRTWWGSIPSWWGWSNSKNIFVSCPHRFYTLSVTVVFWARGLLHQKKQRSTWVLPNFPPFFSWRLRRTNARHELYARLFFSWVRI